MGCPGASARGGTGRTGGEATGRGRQPTGATHRARHAGTRRAHRTLHPQPRSRWGQAMEPETRLRLEQREANSGRPAFPPPRAAPPSLVELERQHPLLALPVGGGGWGAVRRIGGRNTVRAPAAGNCLGGSGERGSPRTAGLATRPGMCPAAGGAGHGAGGGAETRLSGRSSTASGAAGSEGIAAGGSDAETGASPVAVFFSPTATAPDSSSAAAAGAPAKCWRTFSSISSLIELEWDCFSVIPMVGRKSRTAFALTSSSRANSLIRM